MFKKVNPLCLLLALSLCLVAWPISLAEEASGKKGDESRNNFIASQVKKIQARALAGIQSKEDWFKTKEPMRQQFLEMLGLWPLPMKTPLNAQTTGQITSDDVIVEKIQFQSFPRLYVTGNLYRPKNAKGKLPAVLYVCGHANVVQQETIDGKKIQVSYGSKVHYQYHPVWFAQNGYVCLAIDTIQLGEIQGIHHGTYNRGMWWWQSLGYTPAGVECWNAIRALDYLQSREEVDGAKLGVTGRSGGGATSWWITAADERIQCAAPVAGIADLEAHLVRGVAPRFQNGVITGHCDCMYFINLHQWDFSQLIALCSPRPVLLGNSDADPIFPVPGYRGMAEKVKGIYRLEGASEKFALMETKGDHVDTVELRRGINAWMNRWLKGDQGKPAGEKEMKFSPSELKVFSKLPGNEINSHLHEHFIKQASWPLPEKMDAKEFSALKERTIFELKKTPFKNWPFNTQPPSLRKKGETVSKGTRLQIFSLASEEEIDLDVFVLSPLKGEAKSLRVEVVNKEGWEKWQQSLDPDLQKLLGVESKKGERLSTGINPGEILAVITPRGIGRQAWSDEFFIQNKPQNYQLQRRLALLGYTLDSLRLWDLLQGIHALRGERAFSDLPINLVGKGEMAGIALYAGVMDPKIASLELENLSSTHRLGPHFIGVWRILDIPQALGMLYPRPVKLTLATPEDHKAFQWTWQFQKAIGKEFIQVAVPGK